MHLRLYWGAISSIEEGLFITRILNSDASTLAVRQFQARGDHNPRIFDKHVFQLLIPTFDAALHAELVATTAETEAEAIVAAVELPKVSFQAQRRIVCETWTLPASADVSTRWSDSCWTYSRLPLVPVQFGQQ